MATIENGVVDIFSHAGCIAKETATLLGHVAKWYKLCQVIVIVGDKIVVKDAQAKDYHEEDVLTPG